MLTTSLERRRERESVQTPAAAFKRRIWTAEGNPAPLVDTGSILRLFYFDRFSAVVYCEALAPFSATVLRNSSSRPDI